MTITLYDNFFFRMILDILSKLILFPYDLASSLTPYPRFPINFWKKVVVQCNYSECFIHDQKFELINEKCIQFHLDKKNIKIFASIFFIIAICSLLISWGTCGNFHIMLYPFVSEFLNCGLKNEEFIGHCIMCLRLAVSGNACAPESVCQYVCLCISFHIIWISWNKIDNNNILTLIRKSIERR